MPWGSCLHHHVGNRARTALHQARDPYVPITGNQYINAIALVPVENTPRVNARGVRKRNGSAINRTNAPPKPIPPGLPRMRLALGSSRPTDFVGLPTQNGRQNPLGRIDYSSWGNPEALSHDYDRRRVAIVAEPKQSNCELYTDGQLRPSGRRIKTSDAVKSKGDTRYSNVLASTRGCARKYKGGSACSTLSLQSPDLGMRLRWESIYRVASR